MIRSFKQLLLLLTCACSAISAQADTGVPAYAVHAPNGMRSLLIGSVHVGHPTLRQPAATVFDGARSYVIEHHTTQPFASMAIAPEVIEARKSGIVRRAAWAGRLEVRDIEEIHRRINCLMPQPIPREGFETFLQLRSPYFLSTLAHIPCTGLALPSRDVLLGQAAAARKLPVVTLESEEEIARIRDQLPPELIAAALVSGARANLDQVYDALVDAMNRGDLESVARIVDQSLPDRRDRAAFRALMITGRNAAWMPRLRPALDDGAAVVLVGAAHLPGPGGLIELLRRAGYRVEPTRLPAAP